MSDSSAVSYINKQGDATYPSFFFFREIMIWAKIDQVDLRARLMLGKRMCKQTNIICNVQVIRTV